MKALGCQPVESYIPFKVVVSDVVNLHHYIEDPRGVNAPRKGREFDMDMSDEEEAPGSLENSPRHGRHNKLNHIGKPSIMVRRVQARP